MWEPMILRSRESPTPFLSRDNLCRTIEVVLKTMFYIDYVARKICPQTRKEEGAPQGPQPPATEEIREKGEKR